MSDIRKVRPILKPASRHISGRISIKTAPFKSSGLIDKYSVGLYSSRFKDFIYHLKSQKLNANKSSFISVTYFSQKKSKSSLFGSNLLINQSPNSYANSGGSYVVHVNNGTENKRISTRMISHFIVMSESLLPIRDLLIFSFYSQLELKAL